MADPEPVLYSPRRQVDTSDPKEHNATKNEDRQVGDCDQRPQLCGIDLPETVPLSPSPKMRRKAKPSLRSGRTTERRH